MVSSTSRLVVAFWSPNLAHLPAAGTHPVVLDEKTARQLIHAARAEGTLRLIRSEDWVEPFQGHGSEDTAERRVALSKRLDLPLPQSRIPVDGERGPTRESLLEPVWLAPGDRLLIVDGPSQTQPESLAGTGDRFEDAEDQIGFHLFEIDEEICLPASPSMTAQTNEHAKNLRLREGTYHYVPLTQANSELTFPCIACAWFDYLATGEGHSLGLLVMTARSAEDLAAAVKSDFGEYYSAGAQVGLWCGVPPGFEALDPRITFEAMGDLLGRGAAFHYVVKLHYNLS